MLPIKVSSPFDARIRVFCDQKDKDLKNFWNHIVFHPTDAIEDEWGQQILEMCHKDGAAQTVRLYTMFEEMVTLDEQGQMHFDFSKNDYRLDYLVSKGFDILLSYAFVPGFLTDDADFYKPRYKGNKLHIGKVVDYERWEEICRVYTQHIVDRYGEEQVAKWHLNCYNEPDSGNFFYKKCPDMDTKIAEFCKIYDGFEAGITSVSKKLCLGGPALAQSPRSFEFLAGLLHHIKETGRRIDFVNFHNYGAGPNMMHQLVLKYAQNITRVVKACGFEGLPLWCGEWGATGEGYKDIFKAPGNAFRDNEIFAAYFVKLLTYWDEQGAPFEKMLLCLSGQHDNEKDFLGYRSFVTKNGYPKPIYNAFVLAARLGTEKLCFFNADKTIGGERVSIMPTKHPDGHMSILLAFGDDDLQKVFEPCRLTLELAGLDKTCRVEGYRIDANHANAITKYRELGCPDEPTEEQKAAIVEFAKLKAEDLGVVTPEDSAVKVNMISNTTLLLEIYPE